MSTPILPFAPWLEGTNQNSIPANDNSLRSQILNGLVIGVANDEAGSDSDGDIYIVGSSPSGAFASFNEHDLTIFMSGTWYAYAPVDGIVVNQSGVLKRWNGSAYVDAASGGGGGSDVVDVETPSNVAGTVTLDLDSKSKYAGEITLTANVTTLEFSNLPGSGKYAEYELHITQDGTGSHTFAIPASHKALGGSDTSIASAANAVTVLTASTVDNGTTWRYAMQESA